MPYRRLPTTDKARTRALEAALQKVEFKNGKVAISAKSIEELQIVKSKFENLLKHYEMNIQIQADKNHEFKAKVTSLSPATGAKFALLPPDNASGNFVKTVQRLPIKIEFVDKNDEMLKLIRPGMNVEADILIKSSTSAK